MTQQARNPARGAGQNQSRRLVHGHGMAWQSPAYRKTADGLPGGAGCCTVIRDALSDFEHSRTVTQPGFKTAREALAAWRNHRDRLEAREQANRTADRTEETR